MQVAESIEAMGQAVTTAGLSDYKRSRSMIEPAGRWKQTLFPPPAELRARVNVSKVGGKFHGLEFVPVV